MATIVLRSVGQAVAGPIGAFVGTVIGSAIDSQILRSPRRGPRLNDLNVQDSSYGAIVPRIFGTMRVAGSVIWATELKESEQVSGAKGQPAKQTYSYSANFAVLLSSRPCVRVERIWADGKLLRGAGGDFKVPCSFRFHDGSDDQQIDPLIEAIEDEAPAYRGCAIAVFEGLELAEYGNRIPLLTFELVADETPVLATDIISDVSAGLIAASDPREVKGFAAYGDTRASAIAPILQLLGVDVSAKDGSLVSGESMPVLNVADTELGTAAEQEAPKIERWNVAEHQLPARINVDHYDDLRDYQVGRVSAQSGYGYRSQSVDVPIVLGSDDARGLAEAKIARAFRERSRIKLRLPPSYSDIRPGQLLKVNGLFAVWRCIEVSIEQFAVELVAVPDAGAVGQLPSDPGRLLGPPDIVAAPTQMALFDPPDFGQGPVSSLMLAAANSNAGWRAVPIEVSMAGQPEEGFTAARETRLGFAENALNDASGFLIDDHGSVVIQMVDHGHELISLTDEDLFAGANLAMLGDELIQFGRAEFLGSGRYRLSRLLRGIRGTEWASAAHSGGEPFAMLETDRLAPIAIDTSKIGAVVSVLPEGMADQSAQPIVRKANGEARRPPSPAHLRSSVSAAGDIDVEWVRRSRAGFAWLDGGDVPMGETIDGFDVDFVGASGAISRTYAGEQASLNSADAATLGAGTVTIEVRTRGEFAPSRPAIIQINI